MDDQKLKTAVLNWIRLHGDLTDGKYHLGLHLGKEVDELDELFKELALPYSGPE